jgi:hypothetical protein
MSANFNARIIRHYQASQLMREFLESHGLVVFLYTEDYWRFYLEARKN